MTSDKQAFLLLQIKGLVCQYCSTEPLYLQSKKYLNGFKRKAGIVGLYGMSSLELKLHMQR